MTAERKETASRREAAESKQLTKRVAAEAPEPGTVERTAELFSELPLSRATQVALSGNSWNKLTDIQRAAIPHALAGRDVLGAAKTGSGKTLAFLIPVVERLFRERWSDEDGLRAIIVTPTRELALQIMNVLTKLASRHRDLSVGLVCGGRDFYKEQAAIGRMAVLVATPGRLLQHLEQSADLDATTAGVLVLDEADRLLDMGFAPTLTAILGYLPSAPDRQTLLFSATQTKDVASLAKLSLSSPEFVSVHEASEEATPHRLVQGYVVCPLGDKVNLLWSFVKAHLRHRTIVFVSSTKQARFLFEVLRRLRPGVPVMELHGKISQEKRMGIYGEFQDKKAAVLLSTDVAARGLDFPGLDWVLQLDCPEDTAMYIHRVGRTARFRQRGNGLLVLLPQEAPGVVAQMREARIPIRRISIAAAQARSVAGLVSSEVAADAHLRYLAERAFASYVRSVILQPNKAVFDAASLDLDALARSYGLPRTPRSKALEGAASREESSKLRNKDRKLQRLKEAIRAKRAGGADGEHKPAPAAAAAQGAESESSDDDDDDDSSSDGDSSEGGGGEDDGFSDEEDGGGGAILRRKAGAENASKAASALAAMLTEEELLAGLEDKDMRPYERERAHKLTRSALEGRAGTTTLADVAREMGADVRGGQQAGEASAASVQARAAAIAARLEATDGADRQRERRRVHEKHRRERLEARGIDIDEEEVRGQEKDDQGSPGDDDDENDKNEGDDEDEDEDEGEGQPRSRFGEDGDDPDVEGADADDNAAVGKRRRRSKRDEGGKSEMDLEAAALAVLSKRNKLA